MLWLVSLFGCETILEGFICGGRLNAPWRKPASVFAGVLLAIVTAVLSVEDWRVWIWGAPFAAYRLVNLLRTYRARLPKARLRAEAARAFAWLASLQIMLTLFAWITGMLHLEHLAFNVLVAMQLLVALVLLRATVHTWQHAAAPADTPALTDRELPSLSVLVPARNETASLENCLRMLTASNYPKLEILVLDDCSADRRTPEIIRSFAQAGVRFVQGEVPDESRWLAKNYAYEQLARGASGDVLLFCGVDVQLEPDSVRQLVNIMEARGKDMLSVMPLRKAARREGNSLLQAMRYYWELCLPRRFFKRPPVLSACWMIRRESLEKMGGFESVSRSVSPEASFARRSVVVDRYSFIRGDDALGAYSDKPSAEQYGTSVRVRYPQLHRRLELVAIVTLFESVFLLGPFVGVMVLANDLHHTMAYAVVWGVALLCLFVTYALAAVGPRLTSPWYGWLLMPVAFVVDLFMLHVSFWKYEFSSVEWKGRNVCIPVMQLQDGPAK